MLLKDDSLDNRSMSVNPTITCVNESDEKIMNKHDPNYDDTSQIDYSNDRENSNFSSASTATTSSASASNTSMYTDSLSEMCSTSVLSTSSSSDNDDGDENNDGDSTETSLVEEDLEAKKRQLHRAAKLLLKKNKKLRKNFALTADFLIENISGKADQLVAESSQINVSKFCMFKLICLLKIKIMYFINFIY